MLRSRQNRVRFTPRLGRLLRWAPAGALREAALWADDVEGRGGNKDLGSSAALTGAFMWR